MYVPKIFKDNPNVTQRVITYVRVHGFECMDIGPAIRVYCPDKNSVYHYNKEAKTLRMLKDKNGYTPRVITPLRMEGFLEALCAHILPWHKPNIIYNVCKIPFLEYEKDND